MDEWTYQQICGGKEQNGSLIQIVGHQTLLPILHLKLRQKLKRSRKILAGAVAEEDILNEILEKREFWKAIQIVSWIGWFLYNCKTKDANEETGPLTTKGTEEQMTKWVRTVQSRSQMTEKFQSDNLSLNLQENHQRMLECRGRIQGDYPVYLPDKELFSEKLVTHAHRTTLRGGVNLTMAKVRERYCVLGD